MCRNKGDTFCCTFFFVGLIIKNEVKKCKEMTRRYEWRN